MIKRLLKKEFIRFLLTGGLNTAVGYCLYAVLVFITKSAYASVILSTVLGVLFNFKSYGKLTFRSDDHSLLYRFIGVYSVYLVIQLLFLSGLNKIGITNPWIAGAVMAGPMALLSYVMLKKIVFTKQSNLGTSEENAR